MEKTDAKTYAEIERLFLEYEKEVEDPAPDRCFAGANGGNIFDSRP